MSEQIPTIDIYDRQFHKSPAWKKYFDSESIDAELSHPDFENREKMRRKIAQKALNQYIADLMELASSDWINDEMPVDNNKWFELHIAHDDVLRNLFAHLHRLCK